MLRCAQEELKHKFCNLTKKYDGEGDGVPYVAGQMVYEWGNKGQDYGKVQGKIKDTKCVEGPNEDSFFSVIQIVAADSTTLSITCWNDNAVQQLLGCSMKEHFYEFEYKRDMLSSDKLQVMIDLVNKREEPVKFIVKDTYKHMLSRRLSTSCSGEGHEQTHRAQGRDEGTGRRGWPLLSTSALTWLVSSGFK